MTRFQIIANSLIVRYRLLVHRICKLCGCTLYFSTKYGVKAYNKNLFVLSKEDSVNIEIVDIAKIRLGFDALKDSYTHLDKSVENSPHYEMVKLLNEGHDITHCRYVEFELRGMLDGRYELGPLNRLLENHISANKREVDNNYPIVYKIDGLYYIVDGKHRIAKELYKGAKTIQCIVVSPKIIFAHIYTKGILDYMKNTKGGDSYIKNITHIDRLAL